ncbi:unnamed protein product [Moneuplotes crassus]|uniref:C2H2-type domain-containing protein n=1 Tax=Euplotes crassus TaxID=5936 RepID=A0AAD1XXJ6_EUPCR|nr:unnamed protein product [Moneuplotes crassus]
MYPSVNMANLPGSYSEIPMVPNHQAAFPTLNCVSSFLSDIPTLQVILKDYCFCDAPLTTKSMPTQQWGTSHQYIHPGLDSKILEENRVDPKILSLYSNIKDNKSKTVSAKADKVFMCSFGNCRKVFYKKWNFSLHMKMHYKIKQFKCQACGKEFTQKCNYNKHMKTHSCS